MLGAIIFCDIGSTYSQLKLLKDTPLFIYYCYSREYNKFSIGKYNKATNVKTDIYTDNGSIVMNRWTFSETLQTSDNEIIAIRSHQLFEDSTIDKIIFKKYIIDYNYEKIYSKKLDLDCSILPKGYIPVWNDSTAYNVFNSFESNGTSYFYMWQRNSRLLYLGKKISDSEYTILQEYELTKFFTGVVPYDSGKILIFYDESTISFISFSEFEERFEQTNSIAGSFISLAIDKNKVVWLQSENKEVQNIGINIPTSSNADFRDTDLEYKNADIESMLNVYCKNFNGSLVESDINIVLYGPVVFSDTRKQTKIIKTTQNAISSIPITIVSSGIIEANAFII